MTNVDGPHNTYLHKTFVTHREFEPYAKKTDDLDKIAARDSPRLDDAVKQVGAMAKSIDSIKDCMIKMSERQIVMAKAQLFAIRAAIGTGCFCVSMAIANFTELVKVLSKLVGT